MGKVIFMNKIDEDLTNLRNDLNHFLDKIEGSDEWSDNQHVAFMLYNACQRNEGFQEMWNCEIIADSSTLACVHQWSAPAHYYVLNRAKKLVNLCCQFNISRNVLFKMIKIIGLILQSEEINES